MLNILELRAVTGARPLTMKKTFRFNFIKDNEDKRIIVWFKFLHLKDCKRYFLILSNDPPCKDGSARLATILLKVIENLYNSIWVAWNDDIFHIFHQIKV